MLHRLCFYYHKVCLLHSPSKQLYVPQAPSFFRPTKGVLD